MVSVRDVDSTMMVQNATRHSWKFAAAEVSGIHVQWGSLGSGNITEGQSSGDGHVIYLPLTDTCTQLVNGAPLEKNAFMILEPGSEFCLGIGFEHDWCSIFIPTQVFDLGRGLAATEAEPNKMISRTTRPDRLLADRLRASVHHILSMASRHPEFESSVASKVVAEQLQELGALIVQGKQRSETEHAGDVHRIGRRKVPRQRIIRRCHELLEARSDESIRVADLTDAAGVSERTLQAAFKEYYGTVPARYLQLRTLHRVRRALCAADPKEATVTSVLLQHGEYEFGRFAGRYRRIFGEYPSQTLRSRRPVVQVPAALTQRRTSTAHDEIRR